MKARAWGVMLMFMLLSSLLRQASAGFTSAGAESVSTADSEDSTGVSASSAAGRSAGTAAGFEHRTSVTHSEVQPRFTDPEAPTATDQSTFHVVTESWTINIRSEMSSELLNPISDITINTVTESENPSTVKNITDAFVISTDEQQTASEFRTEQDLTLADHNEQDEVTTDMNTTESISQADSTYMSTTVNRAGSRTLLSVISSNMTLYTEGSRALKTAPDAFTEQVGRTLGYTENIMSTEAYQTEVTNDYTNSTREEASKDSYVSQITQSQSRLPTSKESEVEFTPETVHSNLPPLVTVMNFVGETDTLTNSSNSEISYTSFVFQKDNRTSLSHQETETTDIPLISVSQTMHEETKAPVMETATVDLTTASLELGDVTTNKEESTTRFISTHVSFMSSHAPVSQTTHPSVLTEVISTTSGQVTHKPHVTEEDRTVLVTVTTLSSSSSNTLAPLTTTNVQSSTNAETHLSTSTKPATETTPRTATTVTIPSHPTSGATHPSLSPSSFQTEGVTTAVTTPHLETSTTSTSNNTTQTTQERRTTGTYSKSTSTMSTTVVTTEKYTNTEVTTTQRSVKSTLMPGHICESQPCANGGRCVLTTDSYMCECLPSWSGNTCTDDVDECVNSPCPPASECVNTRGSFSCECPLGYDLHDGHTCTQVRTFLGKFSVNSSVNLRMNNLHELHREILHLLNSSLSILHGYRRSTVRDQDGPDIKVVNTFAMNANMTRTDIHHLLQMSLRNCTKSHCPLRYQLTYLEDSLCLMQKNRCDTQYSVCNDTSGIPFCQCHEGYFKKNPEDTTCRDCGDGFKLVNGTCAKCAFGFGGFNCNNFYGLIAMVVSPAAGGLLLIIIIALIVICCRKDKNDINKIIFKSGELQMAPYSEFPKSSRVSMEWGRETIEMQENGSTKNLLQMTDIYYSPVHRNADLERNGLYPFSGLPGSRHSCIYPAQWNPSFICDDTRRRDYF